MEGFFSTSRNAVAPWGCEEWQRAQDAVARIGQAPIDDAALEQLDALAERAADASDADHLASRTELLISVAMLHFYSTGAPTNAIGPARSALRLSESASQRALLRKALTLYGIVCADTCDIGMAIQCYSKALELAQALSDPQAECVVWINLGSAMMISASYEAAITCYRHVMRMSDMKGDARMMQIRQSAQANVAMACLHLERYHDGLAALAAMEVVAPDPTLKFELVASTSLEYTHTRLLLASGDLVGARWHALKALEHAAVQALPRADIAANNAIGLVEVFEGQVAAGLRRLKWSLQRADSLKAGHRDTLGALVMASEHAHQPIEATEYQRELLWLTQRSMRENIRLHHQLHLHALLDCESDAGIGDVTSRRYDRLLSLRDRQITALERLEALERMAVTASMREDPSGAHPYRVGRLTALLAQKCGMAADTCQLLDVCARLHDLGNIAIPDNIMLLGRELQDHERTLVQTHAVIGCELLELHDLPEGLLAASIARSHHERWDGAGYPDGLAGSSIPLPARIAAICEAFDALTHQRPQRPALSCEHALAEVVRNAGSRYDPDLVDAFAGLVDELPTAADALDFLLEEGARNSRYLQLRSRVSATLAAAPRPRLTEVVFSASR